MLFTLLLCSFVAVNNAVQLSLQPIFNHSEGNLMSQILAHKNSAESDQSLIDLFGKLDPAAINNVITLVEALLSSSQADLDRVTSDSENADVAFAAAVATHDAAVVAKTLGDAAALKTLEDGTAASLLTRDTGVTNLRTTHDQNVVALQATHAGIVAALQAAVDAAVTAKDTRETTKTTANAILNQEKSRLDSEISSLTQVIALLHGVRGHQVRVGRPDYTAVTNGACLDPSGSCVEGLATDTEVHAVTCCSDVLISGWSNQCGETNIYGERDIWSEGCQTLNWNDANAFCSSKGGRLCTVQEIAAGCVDGYGCSYDGWLVWTSSQ